MPTTQPLGGFKLTSPKVLVCDPGYDEETAGIGSLGCFISGCAIGEWCVELTSDTTPDRRCMLPRAVLAMNEGFSASHDSGSWERKGQGLGGDSGLIGLYDVAHFHDTTVIPSKQDWTFNGAPADPADLWYSFVCQAIGKRDAVVIPHGFVVQWDGGMDLDTISVAGKVRAIRLSISGWPDRM